MENIKHTTGSRISELLKEKGIYKKVFAVDMKVSVQTVSSWLGDKSTPKPQKLRKIAKYFGVDYQYLTCDQDYRNFDDMRNKHHDKAELQDKALFSLLESYGYIFKDTNYYFDGHNYFKSIKDLEYGTYHPIYEVTSPDQKKHYIDIDHLYCLVRDFFILLDSRLMQEEITYMWDMDFEDLIKEADRNNNN